MHLHTCLDCGAVIGTGDDCELDKDHDYARCDKCTARELEIQKRETEEN